MKIQLDSTAKTIKIEGNINLKELVEHLQKLLPEDSPFGSWQNFSLDTNTYISNWQNPIVIQRWGDYMHPWWNQSYYITVGNNQLTTGTNTMTTSPNKSYYGKTVNLEIN